MFFLLNAGFWGLNRSPFFVKIQFLCGLGIWKTLEIKDLLERIRTPLIVAPPRFGMSADPLTRTPRAFGKCIQF